MPANKKNTKKNTKKSAPDKTSTGGAKKDIKNKNHAGNSPRSGNVNENSFMSQLAPYIIAVVAILFAVCMYAGDKAGIIGGGMNKLFIGLSGRLAYALPVAVPGRTPPEAVSSADRHNPQDRR